MGFWDKWTKKKVKKITEQCRDQAKYIRQLEKKVKKLKKQGG
jgi:hypothetical protein